MQHPTFLGESKEKRRGRKEEMSGAFVRGAHTKNSMYFKPMIRKSYHNKSSAADTSREAMKLDAEEMRNNNKKKSNNNVVDGNANCWVPHERTGIYYPKGHEKVMETIPPRAGKDVDGVNWFSHN